jgi:hypothetical protein
MCAVLSRLLLIVLLGLDWYAGPADGAVGLSPTASPLAATDVVCRTLGCCNQDAPADGRQYAAPDFATPAAPRPARRAGSLVPGRAPAAPRGADLLYVLMALLR